MIRGITKLSLAGILAGATIMALSATALAAGDTNDNINPPSTAFVATNSGNVTFKGTIFGLPVTVTCTSSRISGTTPASGLSISVAAPTFSSCRDNLGGTDTVTTSGTWGMTFLDVAGDDGATEPNTGDQLQLSIPQGGAKFKSSAFSSCTITVAPNGPASVKAGYNDTNTGTFTAQSVPTSGSGCSTSATATFNGTYVTNVTITDTT